MRLIYLMSKALEALSAECWSRHIELGGFETTLMSRLRETICRDMKGSYNPLSIKKHPSIGTVQLFPSPPAMACISNTSLLSHDSSSHSPEKNNNSHLRPPLKVNLNSILPSSYISAHEYPAGQGH